MLARIPSHELTGWLALFQVHEEEHTAAQEHAKHVADSGDGEVIYHGTPGRPDDEDDDTDGEAE